MSNQPRLDGGCADFTRPPSTFFARCRIGKQRGGSGLNAFSRSMMDRQEQCHSGDHQREQIVPSLRWNLIFGDLISGRPLRISIRGDDNDPDVDIAADSVHLTIELSPESSNIALALSGIGDLLAYARR
jgi:hypothetical protein